MTEAPLTFAVGDIHGQNEKLGALLDRCWKLSDGRAARFVFLGDYIDRGPDSRAVIDTLIDLQARQPNLVICLRGNHEASLLAIVAGNESIFPTWCNKNGGITTLKSYGVGDPAEIPATHLRWLNMLPLFHDDGRRFFVHAGIDPQRTLAEQREDDLLWIREPFLSSDIDFGRLIVHGHTPQHNFIPDQRPNRLNLDTAAAYGGPLTAALFDDSRTAPIDLIQV
jgi:serine/threonine protein phosphatase 1